MLRTLLPALCLWVFWLTILAASSVTRADPPAPGQKQTARGRPQDAAPAMQANPPEYQRLMSLGLEEFDRGHWAEARALFLRGHALVPNARSFRALGMTAFNLKRYPEALRELTQALRDPRRPLPASLRAATRELQDRADTFVGLYQLRIEPRHAELRVDGLTATLELDGTLLLPVGEHSLELEATGYAPLRRPLLVDGNDGETLRLSLRPLLPGERAAAAPPAAAAAEVAPASSPAGAPHVRSPRPAGHVLRDYRFTFSFAAGALAFGAGAIALHVETQQEQAALEERCPPCDPRDDLTERRDTLRRSSVGMFVGSLLLVTGSLLAVSFERQHVRKRRAAESAHASRR